MKEYFIYLVMWVSLLHVVFEFLLLAGGLYPMQVTIQPWLAVLKCGSGLFLAFFAFLVTRQ